MSNSIARDKIGQLVLRDALEKYAKAKREGANDFQLEHAVYCAAGRLSSEYGRKDQDLASLALLQLATAYVEQVASNIELGEYDFGINSPA